MKQRARELGWHVDRDINEAGEWAYLVYNADGNLIDENGYPIEDEAYDWSVFSCVFGIWPTGAEGGA